MLPAPSVVRAADRWLKLLRRSSVSQAFAILRTNTSYLDLTQTQYLSGLDLLRELSLVEDSAEGVTLNASLRQRSARQLSELLFGRSLELGAPPWLPDVDILVPDASELPQDAAQLSAALGVSDDVALRIARQIKGKIDLAERSRIGATGERALVALLEKKWPGSTSHIAISNDGFGYDISFVHGEIEFHLEVKTTIRRGRLVIYLSRHEYEVALSDPFWNLVVIGLGDDGDLAAVATVSHDNVFLRSPVDVCSEARWQSTSHSITPADLEKGLSFLGPPPRDLRTEEDRLLYAGSGADSPEFAWLSWD